MTSIKVLASNGCTHRVSTAMANNIDWPDNTESDKLETAPLVNDHLPPDHRSGFVAVVGRPNVGKSTLMNQFLGQKIAIVSHKQQTTRNQILGILTIASDGDLGSWKGLPPAQVIFIDTPGIHQPQHKLGVHLVEIAVAAILDADLVIWLVDATEAPTAEDRLVAKALHDAEAIVNNKGEARIPVLLILNKMDLLSPEAEQGVEASFLALFPANDWLGISATQGSNLSELLRRIIGHLPLGPRYYPANQITDQQTRFVAAELVREAALNVLQQEVPHALAVQVTEFKRRHKNMTYISANLIVERDSQKKIVIGQKGKTLKKIGQMARPQIEDLVETKVFLDLWVKVRPKWRKKESELRWLGYRSK